MFIVPMRLGAFQSPEPVRGGTSAYRRKIVFSGFGVEKASNSMRKIGTLEVLRLRAINPLLGHRSARRFAQDDGLVGGLKKLPDGCTKHKQIEKVTTAQDDGLVGVWKKPPTQRSG
jgi:hypothetical protein